MYVLTKFGIVRLSEKLTQLCHPPEICVARKVYQRLNPRRSLKSRTTRAFHLLPNFYGVEVKSAKIY